MNGSNNECHPLILDKWQRCQAGRRCLNAIEIRMARMGRWGIGPWTHPLMGFRPARP